MTQVRCEKHGISYNDESPRGCPACSDEKSAESRDVMRKLAQASQTKLDALADDEKSGAKPKPKPKPKVKISAERMATLKDLFEGTAATIQDDAPRISTFGSRVLGLLGKTGNKKVLKFGLPILVVLFVVAWFINSSHYIVQPSPAVVESPLPFPVQPGTRVEVLFAVLGVRPPEQHPTDRRLARFQYGSDLIVDALNGFVYSITFKVSNRVWQGISVGMSEESASGALALLGEPSETGNADPPPPERRGAYRVYDTLNDRPLRQLQAEVRPPNGCLDVAVDLRYLSTGVIVRGDRRWIVVGVGSESLTWVVTEVRITDRSVVGPGNLPRAC